MFVVTKLSDDDKISLIGPEKARIFDNRQEAVKAIKLDVESSLAKSPCPKLVQFDYGGTNSKRRLTSKLDTVLSYLINTGDEFCMNFYRDVTDDQDRDEENTDAYQIHVVSQ